MAASPGVPAPGTELGPCPASHGCEHRDCAAGRKTAGAECRICGHRIGYDTRYYEESGVPVHGLCLDEEEE